MEKYKYLLIDLDDTIFDFQIAEHKALQRLFNKYAPENDVEELSNTYKKINHELWGKYEKGEMKKDEIIKSRFSLTFSKLGLTLDGELAAISYQQFLGEGYDLLPNALETLSKLKSAGYLMYAATNGLERTQRSRIAGSAIEPFFKAVYISEQTGSQKPNPAFFDYVFNQSPEIVRSETLMIGDSISSDIAGGIAAGIDTCWFNVHGQSIKSGAMYEVRNHIILQKLLLQ